VREGERKILYLLSLTTKWSTLQGSKLECETEPNAKILDSTFIFSSFHALLCKGLHNVYERKDINTRCFDKRLRSALLIGVTAKPFETVIHVVYERSPTNPKQAF
jgi:hypothetical protein